MHMNIVVYSLQPGTKAAAYGKAKNYFIGKTVPLFVVDGIVTERFRPVIAIAGFHMTGASKKKKYVEGHFIDSELFGSLDPGAGNGSPLGIYTSPVLVK